MSCETPHEKRYDWMMIAAMAVVTCSWKLMHNTHHLQKKRKMMERRAVVMAELGFKPTQDKPLVLKAETKITGLEKIENEKGFKYASTPIHTFIFSLA